MSTISFFKAKYFRHFNKVFHSFISYGREEGCVKRVGAQEGKRGSRVRGGEQEVARSRISYGDNNLVNIWK